MSVTTNDIQAIIDGSPLPIVIPFPGDPEKKWFMKQPSDWLYDMAQAVREAAVADALAQPEIAGVKRLPPSPEYVARQEKAIKELENLISELEAKKDAILPEEDLELTTLRIRLARTVIPANYTRADELAGKFASRSFESWLMPRLIVDENGKPIFDMSTDEGRTKWEIFDRETKFDLRGPFYHVFLLVDTAKNSKAGQSSS